MRDATRAGLPLVLDLAVETDWELRTQFASDQDEIDAITSEIAGVAAIFARDLDVRLRLSYLRIWTTPNDPWAADDKQGALDEVERYWEDPANQMGAVTGRHDVALFLTGKPSIEGGQAFLGSLCNPAVTALCRYYQDDVVSIAHELGHTLGTRHSHCYAPPLDMCWNQEPGCWDGPVVPSVGTVMSYCHLAGSDDAPVFHPATIALVRPKLEAGACVDSVCGAFVADAATCDDHDPCTADTCGPAGRCLHSAIADGTSCGAECAPHACRNAVCAPGPVVVGLPALACTLDTFTAALDDALYAHGIRRHVRAELRALQDVSLLFNRLRHMVDRFGQGAKAGMRAEIAARLRGILGTAHAPLTALQADLAP